MRTQRTDGYYTYQYIYNGSQLSQLTVVYDDGEHYEYHQLNFAYSADGTPLSVTYCDCTYYYVTNIQGDVIAILDDIGRLVCRYAYDAWGNVTICDERADNIGYYNPLLYRGYVYDQETNLYYLQSRYYNPEWGRFLNADSFVSTGQGVIGNNMFAYCGNNPVSRADPSGHIWTIVVLIVVVVGTVFLSGCGNQKTPPPSTNSTTAPPTTAPPTTAPANDYDDFLDALAMSESSGNHNAVNQYGYQGLYQMGSPALQDAGFKNSSGEWTALANSYGVCSTETFLSNPAAQKVAVTNFHKKVCGYIRAYGLDNYIGTYYQGVEVTLSGLVASCHLVGTWNMVGALKYNNVVTDGNGVPASQYMSSFANYNMAVVWGD